MLALRSEVGSLRHARKQVANRIETLRRNIQIANRPSSKYTASGLKRNREEPTPDDKPRRPSINDIVDFSSNDFTITKPKLSSVVAQAAPVKMEDSEITPENDSPEVLSTVHEVDADADAAVNSSGSGIFKRRSRQNDRNRSRRMFGALLGHLDKAKKNIVEEKQAEKNQRRKELEQQVQERIQNDSVHMKEEQLKKLTEELDQEQTNMKETMEKLVRSENKMKAARMLDRHNLNAGLIQTTITPFVLWKPNLHTSRTKKMLLRSRKRTKDALRETVGKLGFSDFEEIEQLLKTDGPGVKSGSSPRRVPKSERARGDRLSSDDEMRDEQDEKDGTENDDNDMNKGEEGVVQPDLDPNTDCLNGDDEMVDGDGEAADTADGVVVVVGEVDHSEKGTSDKVPDDGDDNRVDNVSLASSD